MTEQDEDRQVERLTILRRRAQLMACAVVAGVGTPQCAACLSPIPPAASAGMPSGSGGSPASGGAGVEENAGQGGQAFCLTIAENGGAPVAGAPAGGEGGGGGLAICLSIK